MFRPPGVWEGADRLAWEEHLHSYSRPITTEPFMVHTDIGRLVGDFERWEMVGAWSPPLALSMSPCL